MSSSRFRKPLVYVASVTLVLGVFTFGDDVAMLVMTPLPSHLRTCVSEKIGNDTQAQEACSTIPTAANNSVATWLKSGADPARLQESKIWHIYSTGFTGIGTSNPGTALDVAGAVAVSGQSALSADSTNIYLGDNAAGDGLRTVRIQSNGGNAMTIDSSGQVGIGTTDPAGRLDVNGNIILGSSTGNKSIYTWSGADGNWRIGSSSTPGFNRAINTAQVQYVTYAGGATQGFAVGVQGGDSGFEIRGSDHAAWFRGQITARQGIATGFANGDSGLTGDRPYQFGYQEGGAWTSPFPDLIIGYHTGIKLGALPAYNGVRFYADHPSQTTTQLFSVGDGDNDVRVYNNLRFLQSNPTIYSPSYLIIPGGAYFNSGTVYTEAILQNRGGVQNDSGNYGGDYQVHDNVSITGNIREINNYRPAWGAIRMSPDLYLNAGAHDSGGTGNYAVIANWDNYPSSLTNVQFKVGSGWGEDLFVVRRDGWFYGDAWSDTGDPNYYVDPEGPTRLNTVVSDNMYTAYNNGNRLRMGGNTINLEYSGCPGCTLWGMELNFAASTGIVRMGYGGSPNPSLSVNGPVYATSYPGSSDIRLKENIVPIEGALEKVTALRGVEFDWKDKEEHRNNPLFDYHSMGFIAQEIEKVFPYLVSTDLEGYKAVSYANLTAVLAEAIKELNGVFTVFRDRVTARLEVLESRDQELADSLKRQEETIREQEQRIQDLERKIETLTVK